MTIVVDDGAVRIEQIRVDVDDIVSVTVRSDAPSTNYWADALVAISVVIAGLAMSMPWLWPVVGVVGYLGLTASTNPPRRRHRLVLNVAGTKAVAEESTNEAEVNALQLQVQGAMARTGESEHAESRPSATV
jgi:hypothetical protein